MCKQHSSPPCRYAPRKGSSSVFQIKPHSFIYWVIINIPVMSDREYSKVRFEYDIWIDEGASPWGTPLC